LLLEGDAVHGVTVRTEHAADWMDPFVIVEEIVLHPAELGLGVDAEALALRGSLEICRVLLETCGTRPVDELTERYKMGHGSCLRPFVICSAVHVHGGVGPMSWTTGRKLSGGCTTGDTARIAQGAEWPPK
jgi:hypothetical protein